MTPFSFSDRARRSERTEDSGGADLGYTVEDVINPRWIIHLGVAP